MKIIHTADLHIGSPMNGVADSKLRRQELLKSMYQLVQYAINNNVGAVIIAGDLIDGTAIQRAELADIGGMLALYPQIQYYIVKGNHGDNSAYNRLAELGLCNVHYFGDQWSTYMLEGVAIHGIELQQGSGSNVYDSMPYVDNVYNIAVLHGDVDSDDYGLVDTKRLVSRYQYVALGHRHSYMIADKKGNSVAVYSGVLEARGFDELTPSGFVLLDTVTGRHAFVEQHIRKVHSVDIDCTGAGSVVQIIDRLAKCHIDSTSYVNVRLTGYINLDINIEVLNSRLRSMFFALRLVDNTTLPIDYKAIGAEMSLRGKVVQQVLADSLSQHQQRDVVRVALHALQGEDILW